MYPRFISTLSCKIYILGVFANGNTKASPRIFFSSRCLTLHTMQLRASFSAYLTQGCRPVTDGYLEHPRESWKGCGAGESRFFRRVVVLDWSVWGELLQMAVCVLKCILSGGSFVCRFLSEPWNLCLTLLTVALDSYPSKPINSLY